MKPDKTYNFSRMSVLLVDDNRFIRSTVRTICRSFGFADVLESDDGSEALQMMRQGQVDIVVCDWMMEPLDGFDFTRLLRTAQDSPNPFVPVIMLTGHTEYSKVTSARDVGVTEFLAKPISSATLLSRFIHVCENPRPFVRCPGFFGPDRRRKVDEAYKGPERRTGKSGTVDPKAPMEATDADGSGMKGDTIDQGWGLSEDEINAILAEEEAAKASGAAEASPEEAPAPTPEATPAG